ncbi:MAG TPA: RHS repeat-associated core domain-containing protein, partial [Candidatus Acidoferrales bacterium]|nr:RHS repeat-associated core domain-containing protein [Candidatus Acidoferrales bacterium]
NNILRQTEYQYFGATGDVQKKSELVCPSTYADTTYTYDSYGNPLTITDPMSIVTTISYDPATAMFPVRKVTGNLTNSAAYDSRDGDVLFATNEQGIVTANTYDALLRPTGSAMSTAPNGAPTLVRSRFAYALGGMTTTYCYNFVHESKNDPASPTGWHDTVTYLDGLGRPIQTLDQAETNGQYRVTDIGYDSHGQVLWESYPAFASGSNFVQFSGTLTCDFTGYDALGRARSFYPCATVPVSGVAWTDFPTPSSGDGGSPTGPTSLSFHDGGNPWAFVITNALGKVHKYLLDAHGRTNTIVEVTSGGNFTTTLAYSQVGDLTNITDNAGNKIAMYYDLAGQRVALADPDMGFWRYNYDLDGRLKTQTDAKGQQTRFTYDSTTGRVTRREGWNAANQCVSTNTWQYDSSTNDTDYTVAPGQLYRTADDEGWQKFSYDPRGRTLKSVRYLSKNGNSYTNQFTYDDADRLTSTVYPNGGPVITNLFDAGEHLSKVFQQGGTNFYTAKGFNALQQLSGINFGNGVATTLGYYSVSKRLQQITTAKATNMQSLAYSYDMAGNISNVIDGVYSGNASGTIGKIKYDDLNRLLSLTNTAGTFTYGYNSIGNLLTNQESGTSSYVYAAIRPHAVRSAGGLTFTYDQNGNVVFRGHQRLDYDVNNHLYRVINTNGTLTTFGYAGTGERLWEQSGTNALQVWIGGNYEEKGGQTLYHIYAAGRQVATVDKTGTNTYQYYHPDDLTSTSIQTDQYGNEIQNFTYTAFGQSRYTQNTNAFKVSRRYTGQVLDDVTGLYYYNFRYYDPILGRFTQPDDVIQDIFNPQSYNRYSYCVNNPLRYTDPTGHYGVSDWWSDTKQGAAIISGGISSAVSGAMHSVGQGISHVFMGDTSVQWDPNSYNALNGGTFGPELTDAKGNKLGNAATAPIKAGGAALLAAGTMMTPAGEEGLAVKEGSSILKNFEKGKAFEGKVGEGLEATKETTASQVTLETESGVKTRVDFATKDEAGQIGLTEAKSSSTARLTPNQAKAFPEIEKTGATVKGQGKPGFPGGTQIPPTKVDVVRPTPEP